MRKFLAIGRYEASFGKERDDVYEVFDSLEEAIKSCLEKDEKGHYVMVDGSDDPIEEITQVEFKDGADHNFDNHDYMRFAEVKSWRKSELDKVFRTEEEEELLERQRKATKEQRVTVKEIMRLLPKFDEVKVVKNSTASFWSVVPLLKSEIYNNLEVTSIDITIWEGKVIQQLTVKEG